MDGGIYDNLGVDSVLNSMSRDNNEVIVSDASAIIEHWESKKPTRFMKLNRTIEISMDQSKKLRLREYEREAVLKILKMGDDMKVFESHKELDHGEPLKERLDMIL